MKLGFTGTVVECVTRWKTSATTAFVVGEIQANWVLTIDVEAADEGAPARAGTRASFMIHSPTHTLRVAAEDAPGRRFRFEVKRRKVEGGVEWSELVGHAIE